MLVVGTTLTGVLEGFATALVALLELEDERTADGRLLLFVAFAIVHTD